MLVVAFGPNLMAPLGDWLLMLQILVDWTKKAKIFSELPVRRASFSKRCVNSTSKKLVVRLKKGISIVVLLGIGIGIFFQPLMGIPKQPV